MIKKKIYPNYNIESGEEKTILTFSGILSLLIAVLIGFIAPFIDILIYFVNY
jgi:hypothetical protein